MVKKILKLLPFCVFSCSVIFGAAAFDFGRLSGRAVTSGGGHRRQKSLTGGADDFNGGRAGIKIRRSSLPGIFEDDEPAEDFVVSPVYDEFYYKSLTLDGVAKRIFSHCPEFANSWVVEDAGAIKFEPRGVGPCFPEKEFIGMLNLFREMMLKFMTEQQVGYGSLMRRVCVPNKHVIFHDFGIGDIHGSVHSLMRDLVSLKFIRDGIKIPAIRQDLILEDECYLVFTGDYVDRGWYGVETLFILMLLAWKNPNKVFLGKGNHEGWRLDSSFGTRYYVSQSYGFVDELDSKYPMLDFTVVLSIFDFLYQAIFVGDGNNWIAHIHGGLSVDQEMKKTISNFLYGADNELQSVKNDDPNHLWGDVKCGDGEKFGCRDVPDASSVGIKLMVKRLQELGFVVLVKGHQHFPFGVSGFSAIKNDLFSVKGEEYLLTFPVYVLMSCPEGLGGPTADCCNCDGYADISIIPGEPDKWTIKAYQRDLLADRDGKFVSMTRTDDGVEFS